MYFGYVALSVFFRVCTSVNLLRMRYVLRFRCHYETSLEWRVREGKREEQRPLACTIQKKRKIKSGTSGCGSFVVPYFQPATSTTDHWHLALRPGLEVGKPNNIPANNRQASNGHSQTGQRKNYSDEHLNLFCNLCQVLVCPKCTTDGHKDHLWVLLKWATAYGYASDALTQGRSKLEKS